MTYREAEQEAAQAFHAHEMATDTASDRAYARFLANVGELTGLTEGELDEDNSAKAKAEGRAMGWSLDDLLEQWEAGWTPERAAEPIIRLIDDRRQIAEQFS